MAINKEKVRDLLGSGLTSDIVATAVGCDPSYISQLMGDETFADEVAVLRSAALLRDTNRDRSIGALEDRLLTKLDKQIDYIVKPREILAAFAILNRAERRGTGTQAPVAVRNTVVNLNMPQTVIKKFVMNTTSEVVEVDNQTLVTMPATDLLKRLSDDVKRNNLNVSADGRQRKDPINKYERAGRFIANS